MDLSLRFLIGSCLACAAFRFSFCWSHNFAFVLLSFILSLAKLSFPLFPFAFLLAFLLCRQSKQVQETVGRRRNGEPKYKKITRLLVRMLDNLRLKCFLMGNLRP